MAYLIADEMERSHDILKAIKTMMRKLVGPYCITVLHDGRVFGIRDPYGVRPLCIGELPHGLAIVSESVGLDVLDAKLLRDVVPGEVVELTENGVESHQMMNRKNKGSRTGSRCNIWPRILNRRPAILINRSFHGVSSEINPTVMPSCQGIANKP